MNGRKTDIVFEYRVVWKREDMSVKRKIFQTVKAAKRYITLLTSEKPWEAFGLDGESLLCCSGHECGCGGITVRDSFQAKTNGVPNLTFVRMDYRRVGPWAENHKIKIAEETEAST